MSTETLERLWELTDRLAEESPGQEGLGYAVLDAVGLILEKPPVRYHYDETPLNSLCFAHGVGNEVHFSFLLIEGELNDDCPIVMTLPGSENRNLIVGANLIEFLRLGSRSGYLNLDRLAENLDETIGLIESADDAFEEEDEHYQHLLDSLCTELGLFPWLDIETRLRELQSAYCSRLQF